MFYAETPEKFQQRWENNFWQKVQEYSEEFCRNYTISKINAFLGFMQNFRMAAKNGVQKVPDDCVYPVGLKISSKLLYLAPFPRLMCSFFRLKWKFNMAAKNGGKTNKQNVIHSTSL